MTAQSANKRLWAPWRIGYMADIHKKPSKGCLFCMKQKTRQDSKEWILHRGRTAYMMLNKFPYSNGHLLIAPYRHAAGPDQLDLETLLELQLLIQEGIARLKEVFSPQGYNVGMNLGRVAGAGVPGHLHWHVVPRWRGDTNFMSVASSTKVISQSLDEAYRLLKRPAQVRKKSKGKNLKIKK